MHRSLPDRPTVSVIAVVRDEPVDRLLRMVGSIARSEWADPLELVIAAPAANHAQIELAVRSFDRGAVRVVDNPDGTRCAGLNRAVDAASGDVIVRVDARSALPPGAIRRFVDRLDADPRVAVVGGVQWPTAPVGASAQARGIALALRNQWLLGGAAYRDPKASGLVDTVYLGAFRRSDLLRVRYDESLLANEDFELCARFRSAGSHIWLESGVVVPYEPRATLTELARQYHAFGRSKVAMWRRTGRRPNARQGLAILGLPLVALLGGRLAIRQPWVAPLGVALVAVTDGLTPDRELSERGPGPTGLERLIAAITQPVVQLAWWSGLAAAAAGPSARCSAPPQGADR